MIRRILILLQILWVGFVEAGPESETTPTPPVDPRVLLKVSLATKGNEFRIGETISINLAFSSNLKGRYQLNEASYDRSGRMRYERFTITPADGAVDPLADYFAPDTVHIGGGLTGFSVLTKKPWAILLNLNEWVRFTKPGEYRLTVSSDRVKILDRSRLYGASPVTAVSNAITLKIVAPDPAWQRQVWDGAVAKLNAPEPVKRTDQEAFDASRSGAAETLRFLGTPDAVRELVRQMRADDRRINGDCFFGVISSPEHAAARDALAEALAAPDFPITDNFLDALNWVEGSEVTRDSKSPEGERQTLEMVVQALPNKRDTAARVTLYTVLNAASVRGDASLLPPDTKQELIKQLISMFDQLPLEKQVWLLGERWDDIKNPALLPLLKQYSKTDLAKTSSENYAEARRRTLVALRRWYELDPSDARPAVLQEITQPRPRFGADDLNFLPDKELPEVDQALADHFTAIDDDSEAAGNLTSLIARYATGAVLPQVLRKLDYHAADWECGPALLLAYVLRVDPAAAKPRIEKTIASRRKKTRCVGGVLTSISQVHYDPLLEKIAIHTLDDSDPEQAADAASMLGGFGSPAAEAPLWRRYEKWSKRWAGHERELNISQVADPNDDRSLQLWLGRYLFEALATGRAWFTDEAKLRRLKSMNKVQPLEDAAERYLERWQRLRLDLTILGDSSFSASVAHYHFTSMPALKEKLTQFAPGTKFVLSWSSVTETNQQCVADIRAFIQSRGMSVEDEKSAE